MCGGGSVWDPSADHTMENVSYMEMRATVNEVGFSSADGNHM